MRLEKADDSRVVITTPAAHLTIVELLDTESTEQSTAII